MNKITLTIITTLVTPLSAFLPILQSEAVVPQSAKVTQITGRNTMTLRRRSGQIGPVSLQTVMRLWDKLIMNPDNNNPKLFTKLEFYDHQNQPLNLKLLAGIENNLRTNYYLPCHVDGPDSFIISWENPKTRRLGCKKGIKVKSGNKKISNNNPAQITASMNPLIGQNPIYQWRYCSVVDETGKGWLGFKSTRANPCTQPLKQCEEEGQGICTEFTTDNWNTADSNTIASIECDNNQDFITTGTGEDIKEKAEELWQESVKTGAKFCGFHVFSEDEILITPNPVNDPVMVQVGEADACLTFQISSGEVTLNSFKDPQGFTLPMGNQYNYCLDNKPSSVSNFDPSKESIAMQIFRAKERGYQFCNELQDSGGQEGSKRTIQLTANRGILLLNYQMYQVPDTVIMTYEDQELVRKENISGSESLSIPFAGKSGQVTVEIIGNQDISTTKWDYTLQCPQ
ncbi:hypothetical protein [Cyanothece sp. BG0011]|uniref:hypothetical protein n=1 Tax=Cyanothece sp. BG0011 TaxID=2082950 RepID=UPI0018E4F575|nr:hypothetical protein [Cyanothece sp. BG0011]